MRFLSLATAFAALPFFTSTLAAPASRDLSGFVTMSFDIGGRTEFLTLGSTDLNQCMSIASGGQITHLWASDGVACFLKLSDCATKEHTNHPLTGEVSFNGSGYLAEIAKHARSVVCGPNSDKPEARTLRMNVSVNRRSEDINMEVSKTGCISLPPDVSINSMTIGSDAMCNLAVDCQTKTPVGGVLTGRVNMQHVQSIARDAGALTCGPRTK